MYHPSQDSFDITFTASGSQLLSESPLLPSSSSHTGHGGDDLSISELSIPDRGSPFTLLARRPLDEPTCDDGNDESFGGDVGNDGDEDGRVVEAEDVEKNKGAAAARLREEKLQRDIFILKKINSSFALFNEALSETESANEVRSLNTRVFTMDPHY
jgi:hypothetical protein